MGDAGSGEETGAAAGASGAAPFVAGFFFLTMRRITTTAAAAKTTNTIAQIAMISPTLISVNVSSTSSPSRRSHVYVFPSLETSVALSSVAGEGSVISTSMNPPYVLRSSEVIPSSLRSPTTFVSQLMVYVEPFFVSSKSPSSRSSVKQSALKTSSKSLTLTFVIVKV